MGNILAKELAFTNAVLIIGGTTDPPKWSNPSDKERGNGQYLPGVGSDLLMMERKFVAFKTSYIQVKRDMLDLKKKEVLVAISKLFQKQNGYVEQNLKQMLEEMKKPEMVQFFRDNPDKAEIYSDPAKIRLWAADNFNIVIYYTGHGQKYTGHWCFSDGVVTLDDILQLMKKYKIKKRVTIICDCCYSGKWVQQIVKCYDDENMDVTIQAASWPEYRAKDTWKGGKFTRLCLMDDTDDDLADVKWCTNDKKTMKYFEHKRFIPE